MDIPTEEEMAEFYEFQAGQFNQPSSQPIEYSQPESQPQSQVFPSQKETPTTNCGEHSFFQNNSQLSQIPPNDTVNRRLFGTPLNGNVSNRVASTPFVGNSLDTPNPYRFRFDEEEEYENNLPLIEQNPRKRRLDDLFGDIDDIEREENRAQVFYSDDFEENAKKRARSEEEVDQALIERILAARAEHQARTSNYMKQSKLQQLEALRKFKARNLSETYPQWPCIPVIGNDRDRIYVRMHSEDFETKQINELSLQKNFNRLLGNTSEEIWNDAQKIVEKRMTSAQTQDNQLSEIDEVVIVSEANPNAGKIWVEKYKPKGYFDLLSDESTNRSLLTWLKMWDKVVFNSGRLAERLHWIARREKLKSDMTTLLALAEKSGNDVRSCISVLQFFANSNKPLELIDVMKSNIGQKDKQKGLFEIWSSVFQIQRNKDGFDPVQSKAIGSNLETAVEIPQTIDTSMRSRVERVLNVVHMGGECERLINGVFENYLSQKTDGNFWSIVEACEWFCFSDLLNTQIQTLQNYTVYPYLPYGFAAWHLLFAGISWPKIIFPTQGFEYYQKSSTQKTIRASFIKNMSVLVRSIGNSATVISDAIATIRQIICPSLRSVSLQLLTPKERADLAHTVDVMVDLGLTYSQTKNPDGTYHYQIEPDINFLCNFKVNQRSNELTYSNMQIIAREVELQTMRRSAPKNANANANTSKTTKAPLKPKPQNHLQKLNTKGVHSAARTKDLVTKDFFGRITEKRVALPVQEGGRDQIVKSPIWYRYKEGYNNAVRKDLTLQSLL